MIYKLHIQDIAHFVISIFPKKSECFMCDSIVLHFVLY